MDIRIRVKDFSAVTLSPLYTVTNSNKNLTKMYNVSTCKFIFKNECNFSYNPETILTSRKHISVRRHLVFQERGVYETVVK